jgi:hypothetical protein
MKTVIFIILSTALLLQANVSRSDEFKPLNIKIIQTSPDPDSLENASIGGRTQQPSYLYRVESLIPESILASSTVDVVLNNKCKRHSSRSRKHLTFGLLHTELYHCSSTLRGTKIEIQYARKNPGLSTIISAHFINGESASIALSAHQLSWVIPKQTHTQDIVRQYFSFGFEHLITGYDHVLFIACLIFLCVGRIKSLLLSITAFTIAHSVSLALTVFNVIKLNVIAVEAVIALSIVYLAREVVAQYRTHIKDNVSHRYPATIAGAFGLLHGLGFANILSEFGLPQTDRLYALLSFNIGIEVGQLCFIAIVLIPSSFLLGSYQPARKEVYIARAAMLNCYLAGIVAVVWTIERVAGGLA